MVSKAWQYIFPMNNLYTLLFAFKNFKLHIISQWEHERITVLCLVSAWRSPWNISEATQYSTSISRVCLWFHYDKCCPLIVAVFMKIKTLESMFTSSENQFESFWLLNIFLAIMIWKLEDFLMQLTVFYYLWINMVLRMKIFI